MHTKFWWESLKGRDYSEDLGVDGKIILEWILENQWDDMDRIHLAQDRENCCHFEHGNEPSGYFLTS